MPRPRAGVLFARLMRYGLKLTSRVKHANNPSMALTSNHITNHPKQLIIDMAIGLDSDEYLAELYGYTITELQQLREHPIIRRDLATLKSEFDAGGITLQRKNIARAEVLQQLYYDAVVTEGSLAQKREAAQFFTKMADLEPKPSVTANAGTGFSINIILKDQNGHKTTLHAEAPAETVQVVEGEVVSSEVLEGGVLERETNEAMFELPEVPAFLADKRVTANSDLSESV